MFQSQIILALGGLTQTYPKFLLVGFQSKKINFDAKEELGQLKESGQSLAKGKYFGGKKGFFSVRRTQQTCAINQNFILTRIFYKKKEYNKSNISIFVL